MVNWMVAVGIYTSPILSSSLPRRLNPRQHSRFLSLFSIVWRSALFASSLADDRRRRKNKNSSSSYRWEMMLTRFGLKRSNVRQLRTRNASTYAIGCGTIISVNAVPTLPARSIRPSSRSIPTHVRHSLGLWRARAFANASKILNINRRRYARWR